MLAAHHAEHDRIRALAERLETFLASDRAPLGSAFPHVRWVMIRELAVHFARERAGITARAATCDPRTALRLDIDLERAWRAHVASWTGARLHQDWRSYRMATRALLARIRMRMVWEERLDSQGDPPPPHLTGEVTVASPPIDRAARVPAESISRIRDRGRGRR